ncbi:High-affinity glucose transporter ght2 [Psilocybe cubensis]|uniref:Major facilitator superfamily (MFS) profile domain-containing protein n=2 Tax=Psilocybe cubensis TaxID=181762 RepID=A0A8H7XR37_PSICU|nr:High-affinity glucose transporter ght2 [Psilocybe cubensis]KAH9475006.1 High-affinity glucose transporter ght2 [Psilocybe cubensis]
MPLFYMHGMPIGGTAIMLALVASMGGFIFGYDTGQISDILLMEDFKLRFATCSNPVDHNSCEFSTVRAGLIVSLLSIGTLAGALMGAPIADGIGRRRAMTAECLLFCIGIIVQLTSFHVWQQVAVGRLISGLAVGALSAAVPMYQAETAPTQIRGTLTATYQLFITLGILVAYCIAIGTRSLPGAASWRTLIGIGFVWPVILGVGILFMPESPRWLVAHGHTKAAERSIARAYGIKAADEGTNRFVQAEVDEIVNQVQMETRLRSGWIDCFKPKNKTLYRTLLGMTLQSFQQLTGANYFFYYGATIFQSVGINDSFVTQIILGAVNFVCTFGGLYVMERFGRRRPLICGGIWQAAWLFVFAAAGTAKDPRTNSNIGKLMIVSACLFILGYAMTWAPGIWILIGETFPTRTRAKQGALSTASNWLWNFLIAFFTPFITSAIDFRYGFVFAACNLTGAVIVFFFLYESSDLSLESVDNMYNDPHCKPWTSSSWAPAGYSSRYDLVEQTKAAQARKPLASGAIEEKQIEHAGQPNGVNGQAVPGYTAAPGVGAGFGSDAGAGGLQAPQTMMNMPEPDLQGTQGYRRASSRVPPPPSDSYTLPPESGFATGAAVKPGAGGREINVDMDPNRGLQGGVGLTKEGPPGGIGMSEADGHGNKGNKLEAGYLGRVL